jgi:spore coat protein U-like protein
MNILKSSLLATAVAVAGMSSASAGSEQDTFEVRLVVTNACTISATDMVFPPVTGSITADIDGASTVTVNCNDGATYSVALDNGANDGGSGQRRLTDGSQTVDYGLFSNAARDQAWGTGGGLEVGGTGNDSDQDIPVYGRVPAGQSVGQGTYTDTVTATVSF